MKRTAICYSCGLVFKVEVDKLNNGERLPCPKCESNSYFKMSMEEEEPETIEVK